MLWRIVRITCVLLGLLLTAIAIGIGFSSRPLPAAGISKGTMIGIDQIGYVFTDDGLVARPVRDVDAKSVNTLTIPLIAAPLSEQPSTSQLSGLITVQFSDERAIDWAELSVLSLEGQGPFTITWQAPSSAVVLIEDALRDGLPTLQIRGPIEKLPGMAQDGLIQSLSQTSTAVLQSIAGLMLLATAGYVVIKRRSSRWKAVPVDQALPVPPGDLRPTELALLHHSTLTATDLTALLLDLADRGYLMIISHANGEIGLYRTKYDHQLTGYERAFLLVLFPDEHVPASLELIRERLNQDLFSAVVSQLYIELYDSLMARGFFSETPRIAHLRYKTWGIVIQAYGIMMSLLVAFWLSDSFAGMLAITAAWYVCGLLVYRAGSRHVPLSRLGRELVKKTQQFVAYLASPGQFKVRDVQPELFFRYSSYAIVVSMENQWAQRFSRFDHWSIPDWYSSELGDIIRPEDFIEQVTTIAEQFARVIEEVRDPNVD
jgi:uncharacterized protein (TIGR04222 family)